MWMLLYMKIPLYRQSPYVKYIVVQCCNVKRIGDVDMSEKEGVRWKYKVRNEEMLQRIDEEKQPFKTTKRTKINWLHEARLSAEKREEEMQDD